MASADEEAARETLPAEERQSHEASDIKADKAYQSTITNAKVELSNLTGRRSLLSESQARLVRELANVEEELALVSQAWHEKAERLNKFEQGYRDRQQARLEAQQKVQETMRRFFNERRGEDPNVEGPEDIEL
ncbi:hypothetical protein BGZ61DRAFT_540401 [Ilyonectria robusta]|uniref:uncharacterized protein n=1 Tax=Ilyonectria robusta TaxID=1079257 RepID=UPI001E8EE3A9|nr:uncharacterized protein BGZ61DRAFT_540401 [Ilyonectria robusta]KAH8658884.1 hypothetical protein BGZ61DRAFT_540401 [Ilyonectria robusta]